MAASAPLLNELEGIFTCIVCFEMFNNDANKPKFLSCHHTLCLKCIKAMATQNLTAVVCPMCRKETRLSGNNQFDLPNNHYILEMMASKSSQTPPSHLGSPQPAKVSWCMKCRKEPTNACSLFSDHSIISIGEYCSESHCLELQKIMDNNEGHLRNIIEKRMEGKNIYSLVNIALKLMEDEVRKLEQENDLRIVEIVSFLENPETLIGNEANVQSLAKKVQKDTDTVKKELADFLELEGAFFTIIRDQGLIPIGGRNSTKITVSVASQILLTLIKSGIIKSNEISTGVKIPPPKPNRKPNLKGFMWVDSTTLLSRLAMLTPVSGNSSTNSPISNPHAGPSSR